jgi:Flp pilus assembly protein TadD
MQHLRSLGRTSLLALSLLSACAAADPPASASATTPPPAKSSMSGVFGRFLTGRFALAQSDPGTAADDFLKGLAAKPGDSELLQQAFVASVLSGRTEAVQLAQQLPDTQIAQLVLGNQAARAGHWQAAQERFRGVPRQGLTQLLGPILEAWARQGAGDTTGALGVLQPAIQGQRFRGIFALHAAMIADLAGRTADAERLYQTARREMPEMNLRMGQIIASWQARSGHLSAARTTLASLGATAPELGISLAKLGAGVTSRPVPNAIAGLAESYLALAATLRSQQSGDYAMLMLRLALDLRPDFTAARLLASEVLAGEQHHSAALEMLAGVPASDPLDPLVRLRRAALTSAMGRTDDAMRALEKLAADFPHNAAPLMLEGDLLRGRQRYSEAASVYTRAIADMRDAKRSDWVVFYSRGIAYERSHEWDKAEADLKHALQLAPDQPAVLNYLGYSWAERGEHLAEARSMIQKAAASRPNDGAIADSLGWVMLRQGQTADAVGTLERAVELEPEDSTINGHLGDAYWAAGRKLEAEYQWRRALTLNPAPDDLAKLEAKLQTQPKPALISGQ